LRKLRIALVIGTRPEAIKMAPVIYALRELQDEFETTIIATAQHRELLDQVLSVFRITPQIDLGLMRPSQALGDLTSRVLSAMGRELERLRPDLVVVQGDTTTAFASALAAFYLKIPVAHIEAGLRSHNPYEPFPEEMNRRLITTVAELHFAPTQKAWRELMAEGASPDKVVITGNTVVDALHIISNGHHLDEGRELVRIPSNGHRVLLVTCHRRESWGKDLGNICLAVRELVERFEDLCVVYPMHVNPVVRGTVQGILGETDRIFLTPPLDYLSFVDLMRRSHLVLTDSGGVQEEAPSFNKPVLVLRRVTERPENADLGLARLVGTNPDAIVSGVSELLGDSDLYSRMSSGPNPYGDGKACERIVEALRRWAQGRYPLLDPGAEFVEPQPRLQTVATQ
jgi:UDP-N-acetylglucosamine 2-epimerase (non-hydrolysing)